MNKYILRLGSLASFFLLSISTYSQNWRVDGNTNAQLGGSLTPSIGTNQNRPLLIETNGTTRLFINNGTGFVGLGNNFTVPLSLLHINGAVSNTGEVFRTDAAGGLTTNWRMFRGGVQYGRFFNVTGSNDFTLEASQQHMIFNVGGAVERMRIVGITTPNGGGLNGNAVTNYPVTEGNVGIGTIFPMSMLHIGNTVTQSGGYRDWMDVGTLLNQSTDNMYVGFGPNTGGGSRAVINWGNNPAPGAADALSFVFTAAIGLNLPASTTNGLEIATMITNGTPQGSRMGVGDFLILNTSPKRRLDVLDQGENLPQFRLTNTTNANTALGIYTDFQTTNIGDLFIDPHNGNALTNVGISVIAPTEKIDVNGNARLRNTSTATADYLMTGIDQQGAGAGSNDIVFSKIAFNNNPNTFLDGTGNFTAIVPGGGADPDWFASINANNPPASINEDVYTFGSVGVGLITPNSNLHIHDVFITQKPKTCLQITNNFTGTSSTDGLKMCIRGNLSAEIMQEETARLDLGTSSTLRMRIEADGDIGINVGTPNNKLEIASD
ncbi:MAG: hypothetical protein JKY42_03325, partial [Flavobacteriales bacterium]|nr:hypothetical protein [Flavobacteriales bacterium]